MRSRRSRRAFTLIEILVVVAIIALLISILIPSLARAREQTRRTVCTSNVHQIMIAANMYAMQHPRGQYMPHVGSGGGDGLGYLYPAFIRDFHVVICPSTKNVVVRKEQLDDNAENRDDSSGGHSYECRAWIWSNRIYNGKRFAKEMDDSGHMVDLVKSIKNISRPSQVCLLTDGDDGPLIENWPDRLNNHGAEGVNVGYCDGHALWTPTGRRLMSAFLSGYYDAKLPADLYQKYGVTRTESDGWIEFKW